MDIHSECNNSPTSRMEVKKNINTCNNSLKMSQYKVKTLPKWDRKEQIYY